VAAVVVAVVAAALVVGFACNLKGKGSEEDLE
jgi:hypothetical protein